MDKMTIGLVTAVAGLATMGSAHAALAPAPSAATLPKAVSYADLLAPIPDAMALLKADDAARSISTRRTETAQVYYGYQYYSSSPYYSYATPYTYSYSPYSYQPYYYHHHHHHHHHHHGWR